VSRFERAKLRVSERRSGRSAAEPQAEGEDAAARDGRLQLMRRRERLTREFTELQYDLGGLAYEMAIRDHIRLDVLMRAAARLQEVDAELGEIDRLLHLKQAGATGRCPSCGALHGYGSSFCWQCGTQLIEPIESVSAPAHAPSGS
jgi:hypothetical protein